MLSSSHRERAEQDSVPWRMKNWWQNSIYIWLSGWTGWLCTTGQKAEPGETLSWRRHSFAEVWYACSRTPQAGSESITGLHTVSQGTIRQTPGKELIAQAATLCLCTAQAGSVRVEFVRCLRFRVCTWAAWCSLGAQSQLPDKNEAFCSHTADFNYALGRSGALQKCLTCFTSTLCYTANSW